MKKARREVTRVHVLESAERVFAERGYGAALIREVAKAAGVALSTVYELYAGKEELYADIFRTRGRALIEAAATASQGAGSAKAGLLAGVASYVGFLCAHPAYLRVQLHEKMPWALMPSFHSDEQRRLWHDGLELSASVFRAAIDEGSVIDEEPETLARLMIAAHQVHLGRWVENEMKEPVPALIARMQAHVERAFCVAAGQKRRARNTR